MKIRELLEIEDENDPKIQLRRKVDKITGRLPTNAWDDEKDELGNNFFRRKANENPDQKLR